MNNLQFQLKKNVHIWVINKKYEERHVAEFKIFLSDEEETKANKFRFKKDRYTYIIARGALRLLLGKYLNIAPEKLIFKYGEFGKPGIDSVQNLKFNISHSKDLIVLGFIKDLDIGIDVEFMKKDFDVMEIIDNFFSKREIEAITGISKNEKTEAFYRGWTRKEAFIKAKARGLSFPLDSFTVSIDSDKIANLSETLWDSNEIDKWSIIPFNTLNQYKAAVVIGGKIEVTKLYDFNLRELSIISCSRL